MATIMIEKPIGTGLPGRHAAAYGWVRPMTQGVALLGFVSTDNSTGVSAREHRLR